MTANADRPEHLAMVDCYWDFLNGKAEYQALGLREFRKVDGCELYVDGAASDPSFADDDMPAHATSDIEYSPLVIHEPGSMRHVVVLTQSLIFRATGDLGDCVELAKAQRTLVNLIYAPAARRMGLDNSGRIAACELTFDRAFVPTRGRDNVLRFWICGFTVTLTKGFRSQDQ